MTAIELMTDTDNTGAVAGLFYGDLSLSPAALRCDQRFRIGGDQDAAADALDQDRVDRAAPPAQRERLAARMSQDQEVDAELGNQLGQDIDRLADDQVIDDVYALGGEQPMRRLEVGLMCSRSSAKRDLRHITSPASRYADG